MIPFKELTEKLPAEIKRIEKMRSTLQGWLNLIKIHEAHFNEKYIHGTNVVYDIARANIIKQHKLENPLC